MERERLEFVQMSDADNEYFIVGGRDLERYQAMLARREDALDQSKALEAKYGGKAAVQHGRIVGFLTAECPRGWREAGRLDGKPFYYPYRKTKTGKETDKELSAVKIPNGGDLHMEFCGNSFGVMAKNSFSFRSMSSANVGGVDIFILPVGHDFKPDGSRQIPASEYWRMKEAAAEARQEGGAA